MIVGGYYACMETRTLHSKPYKALTSWLKAQRESKGLTLREFATKAGIYNSFIAKVEQQERNLAIVEYVQYCEALGVDPAEGIKIIQKELKASVRKNK